jgi:hypothetical protein
MPVWCERYKNAQGYAPQPFYNMSVGNNQAVPDDDNYPFGWAISGTTFLSTVQNTIAIADNNYKGNLEGWKAHLAENPLKIVYPLQEPIKIQLTPKYIEALKDTTTLYSSMGETSVTYNRDINKVIEELRNAIISLGGNV